MFRACIFERFGELLMSFLRAAVLPAALCMPWYATCALAQEVLKTDATAASSSALVAQRLTAFDLVRLAAGHIKGQRLAVDPDKLLGDKGYDSDAIRDDRTAWQAPGALSRIAHA